MGATRMWNSKISFPSRVNCQARHHGGPGRLRHGEARFPTLSPYERRNCCFITFTDRPCVSGAYYKGGFLSLPVDHYVQRHALPWQCTNRAGRYSNCYKTGHPWTLEHAITMYLSHPRLLPICEERTEMAVQVQSLGFRTSGMVRYGQPGGGKKIIYLQEYLKP